MIHGIWRTTSIAVNGIKYCGVGERKVRGWARLRPSSHMNSTATWCGSLMWSRKPDRLERRGPIRSSRSPVKYLRGQNALHYSNLFKQSH